MRHRKGNKHLNRTSAHAQAMVQNTVVNLLRHERIKTTLSKAKVVRRWAEKMITLGKEGTLASRRAALAFIMDKKVVDKVFTELAPRFKERPGGYTRLIKLGPRVGDGAPTAKLELVE